MSRESDVWATPPEFFEKLKEVFRIDRDVCALPFNAKCDRFWTPEDDGLKQDWEGICFMNPPFSETELWVQKSVDSAMNGAVVIALLPAFLDTGWWQNLVHRRADFIIPVGRLPFVRYDEQMKQANLNGDLFPAPRPAATARFGCAVVAWGLSERFQRTTKRLNKIRLTAPPL